MQRLAPVLIQTEGQNGAIETAPADAIVGSPEHAPLFDGPAPALWAGAGAFLTILLLGLILIIRGRVVRATPRKQAGETRTYFEPAGDDAEILFEDEQQQAAAEVYEEPDAWRDQNHEETEVAIHQGGDRRHGDLHDDSDYEDTAGEDAAEPATEMEQELEPEPQPQPKKKKSPFAGLFAKKPKPEPEPVETAEPTPDEETYDITEDRQEDGFFVETAEPFEEDMNYEAPQEPAPPQPAPPEPAAAPAPHPIHNEADAARLNEAEAAASEALKRAEQAEAAALEAQRAQAESERIFKLGMSNRDEALKETQASALKIMEQKLSALSSEFENRLATAPVPPAPPPSPASESHSDFSEAHFAEFADLMGEQFEALRTAVNDAVDRLSKRIDRMPAAAPGEGVTTAARVQLADLLSDVLPPQRFQLNAKLASGRTAEALVKMPGAIAPIAIEARFPVEAFDEWRASKGSAALEPPAETELRRIILRQIADAAEKLIVTGDTADCAMMFVPSEHILSELHARFSDLVQESHRARIWMVGPTSLMATLFTISAVLSGAGAAPAQADEAELKELKTRIAMLETRNQGGAAKQASAATAPGQATGNVAPARTGQPSPAMYTDLMGPGEKRPDAPKQDEGKSPFPLR